MKGITLVILVAGMVGTGADGYLARVGPTQLRFAPPRPPRVALPPLTEERPEVSSAPRDEEAPDPEPVEPLLPPVAMPIIPQRPASPVPPVPVAADTNDIVSPQSLLRFFNQRSVGSNTMIFPLEFVPAAPPERPSSSANYGATDRR